jgi:predicted extracellular nuclease
VTGVNWSSTTAKAYIQDAAGGVHTGVQLYCKYGGTSPTCSLGDTMKALKMGQKVKVVGTWDVYNSCEELKPTAITVLDSTQGALPPYAEISAADADDQKTSSDYEGCLVKITGVSSTTPLTVSSMTPAGFQNTNYSGCTNGPPYSAFEVSDGTSKIAVTTSFYRNIDLGTDGACIMIFDGGVPADKLVVVGDKFNMLSGILDMDPYDMNGIILTPTSKDQYEYVAAGDHDGGL